MDFVWIFSFQKEPFINAFININNENYMGWIRPALH